MDRPCRPPRLDATDQLLAALFRRALRRTALLSLSGAAACGRTPAELDVDQRLGTRPGPEVDGAADRDGAAPRDDDAGAPEDAAVEPRFAPIPCSGEYSYELDDFDLAEPADYAEVRTAQLGELRTEQRRGTLCLDASDRAACLRERDNIDEQVLASLDEGAFERFMVTTQGDVVQGWRGAEGLRAVLGEIDSLSEAVFWLHERNEIWLACHPGSDDGHREVADGFELRHVTLEGCEPAVETRTTYLVSRSGAIDVVDRRTADVWHTCGVAGRRPEGWLATPVRHGPALGAYFAHMAQLEAASVDAFEVLEVELWALEAPAELLDKVRQAIADERGHAALVGKLARRLGAETLPVRVERGPLRNRLALALDNMREGCVREAYGALLATHQACWAEDPEVRRAMARIAEDETRHAGLSFQLAAWLHAGLDRQQRAEVRETRRRAFEELRREVARPEPIELARAAGLPSPRRALALVEELERTLLPDGAARVRAGTGAGTGTGTGAPC